MSLLSLSFAKLDQFRQVGDDEFDAVFSQLMGNSDKKAKLQELLSVKTIKNKDLPEYLQSAGLVELQRFSTFQNQVWDIRTLEKGSQFFEKHKDNIFLLLGILSLPYCYAAAKGALVLAKSRKIIDNPQKRLTDTGWFVDQVCLKGGFSDNGNAMLGCLQTRMAHAYVRFALKESFQAELGEMPINQEDMAGTYLSFSFVVVEGLRKIGVAVNKAEENAFLYLWSAISHHIGLEKTLTCSDFEQATRLEEIIRARQFKPSPQGELLASSLYSFLERESLNYGFPPQLVKDLSAYLLGKKASVCLGLPEKKFSAIEKTVFNRFSWAKKLIQPN